MMNDETLDEMITNSGETLGKISEQQPVLLVFLRHFGCVFCKEALSDLAEKRNQIEEKGTKIIFVHMANLDTADEYFKRYELDGIAHVSDPTQRFYKDFGLTRGNFSQLYGLSTWMRGFSAYKKGHELEMASHLGDSTQMPGLFLLQDRIIKQSYIHKLASDRPNYEELLSCCTNPS